MKIEQQIESAKKSFPEVKSVIEEHGNRVKKIKILDPTDKETYNLIKDEVKLWVKTRTAIEKRRKELKADSLAYGKAVDTEAKRLQALLHPYESHLKAQIEIVDKYEADIKAEKMRRHNQFLNNGFRYEADSGNYVYEDISYHHSTIIDVDKDEFERVFEEAISKKNAIIEAREAEKKALEAENKRLEKAASDKEAENRKLREQLEALQRKNETAKPKQEQKQSLGSIMDDSHAIGESVAAIRELIQELNEVGIESISTEIGKEFIEFTKEKLIEIAEAGDVAIEKLNQ